MKKAQAITIYAILGTVILILVAFLVYTRLSANRETLINNFGDKVDFSDIRASAKIYIESCLEDTADRAIQEYGIKETEINLSSYIDRELPVCVNNFEPLSQKGFSFQYTQPSSKITISEEMVFVDEIFPVIISKENEQISIKDFQYKARTTILAQISQGIIKADTLILSEDKNMIISISQDTKVSDKSGNMVDALSIKIKDKKYDDLKNGAVVGNLVYDGLPDGAVFSPPLEVTIRLKKEAVPQYYPKESLSVGWYDKSKDIWRLYPALSLGEDDTYFYYSASVDHFTPMAIVKCGGTNTTAEVAMNDVYKQIIDPAATEFWKPNKDEDGVHMVPELMGNATCDISKSMKYNLAEPEEGKQIKCSTQIQDWDKDDQDETISAYKFVAGGAMSDTAIQGICYTACKEQVKKDLTCYFSGVCDGPQVTPFAENKAFSYDISKYTIKKTGTAQEKEDPVSLLNKDGIKDGATLTCSDTCTADSCSCVLDNSNLVKDREPITSPEGSKGYENLKTMETADRIIATPNTYGYEKIAEPGGLGYFTIQLEAKGDSCVKEIGIYANTAEEKQMFEKGKNIEIEDNYRCSDQDACNWNLNNPEQVSEFDSIEDLDETTQNSYEQGVLQSGINTITVKVSNTKNAQAYGEAYLYFEGEGISGVETSQKSGLGGLPGTAQTTTAAQAYTGQMGEIFKGVKMQKVTEGNVIYFVVELDLKPENGLKFMVTPKIEPKVMQTTEFLSKNKLQVAVNGGGFGAKGTNEVDYYSAYDGQPYSDPAIKPGDTLFVTDTNEVSIGTTIPDRMKYAISGFNSIVENGEIIDRFLGPDHKDYKPAYDNLEPRTSIGIKETEENGKKKATKMILIVVDGRSTESVGVSLKKLGALQIKYGATKALNMDGGGSSALIVSQSNIPKVVNKPSDGSVRPVANHFGVFALPVGQQSATTTTTTSQPSTDNPPADNSISKFRIIADNKIAAGGQPTAEQYAWLASQGYKTVIDVQGNDNSDLVTNANMKYIHLSYDGNPPSTAWIDNVMAAMTDTANQPVYVHCQYGEHRTGVAVAIYREKYEGWCYQKAYDELMKWADNYFPGTDDEKTKVFDTIKSYSAC